MKNKQSLLFLGIFLLSFMAILPVNSLDTENNNTLDTSPLVNYRPKISSEEENTDDFSVSAESGRWDTTTTGVVDNLVIGGNQRSIITSNETGGSSEYFMQRGLQSSDDKISYRYKALAENNSQVEYFRDVLGDSADFEEGDTEGFTGESYTVENGIIYATSSSFIDWNFDFRTYGGFNLEIYKSISFRMKASIEEKNIGLAFREFGNNSICFNTIIGLKTTLEWSDYSYDFTNYGNCEKVGNFGLSINTVSTSMTGYLEIFKLIGGLDFATHENSIGDTWDWEDSLEYFFDDLGNVSDFNDGTTEGWTTAVFTESNAGNEYYKAVSDFTSSSSLQVARRSSVSITASTYSYLTFEFNSSIALTNILIEDGTNTVCTDSTGWSAGIWYLFVCDLGLDGDWTGSETILSIYIQGNHVAGVSNFFLNMVYLYDTELGDLESFTSTGNLDYLYVNPEGYYQTSLMDSTKSSAMLRLDAEKTVDSTIFDTLKIRVKSESTLTFRMESWDGGTYFTALTTTSESFQIFSFDLSLDPDWIGDIGVFRIQIQDDPSGGLFEGDERILIDYILLLSSEEQSQDFTVGFWDQDNNQALVNITHHFYNSTNFRWEIEFYDDNQELGAYYYSSNQTFENIYYRINLDYDFLQAEFDISITFDNSTRIFRADLFEDFTINNQLLSVFSFGKVPDIFFSSYVQFYGSLETWIDFIDAPFKLREWKQTITTANSNLVQQSPTLAVFDGAASGDNLFSIEYELVVNSLDFVSGQLSTNVTDFSSFTNGISRIEFTLSNVDWDTGDKNIIIIVGMALGIVGPNLIYEGYFENNTGSKYEFYSGITTTPMQSMDFTISTKEERSSVSTKAVYAVPDSAGWDQARKILSNTSINPISSKASQEFVLKIRYEMEEDLHDAGVTWFGEMIGFEFISKDLFGDIGDAIGGLFGGVTDFVGGFFSSIIDAFSNILTAIFLPLILWVGGIIVSAGTVLGSAIIGALSPLLASIIIALGAIAGPIVTAVGAIAADVGTAIWNTLGPLIVGFIEDIVGFLVSIISDLWTDIFLPIINFFLGILSEVFDALIAVLQTILDAIVTWALGFLGLTEIWQSAADFYSFLVAMIFFVFLGGVFLLYSAPIVFAKVPGDVAINYVNIAKFDITFGISFIGIRIVIFFGLFMVAWIIIMGYADVLLPVVPF